MTCGAADEDLRRAQVVLAAERVAGSLADEDTPGWNTPDEAQAWVRALRRADDGRLFNPRTWRP